MAKDVLLNRLDHFFNARIGKEFSASKVATIMRLKSMEDLQARLDYMVKHDRLTIREGRIYNGLPVMLYRKKES